MGVGQGARCDHLIRPFSVVAPLGSIGDKAASIKHRASQMKKGDHLFLVDGSAYIFRAYHALPPFTRKSDGLPIGAVSGFCNMLWKLVQQARDTSVGVVPTHFAVIFDHSSSTFRNEIFDGYKANRGAPPDDLVPQFSLIREATRAFDLACIEREGFEADDIIATFTRQAVEAGGDVTIVSSDKDLMQLLGPGVVMYDTMKDVVIDVEGVREKFGVGPDKMIDLQALNGDSTDNVPGVPGIGPKTASQLLEEFGTLENLLENAGTIKQKKRRENLIEFADQARLSKKLVTLVDNVPMDQELDDLALQPPDGPRLIAFLKGLELNSLTRRVAAETDADPREIEAQQIEVDPDTYRGPDLDLDEDGEVRDRSDEDGGEEKLKTVRATIRFEGDIMRPTNLVQKLSLEASASKIDASSYTTIRDADTLRLWIAKAKEARRVAVDTETDTLDAVRARMVGVSLAVAPGEAAYLPLLHVKGSDDLLSESGPQDGQMDYEEAVDLLRPLLQDPAVLKILQNAKFDAHVFHNAGIDLTNVDDTMLISYALDAGRARHGMDALAEEMLGHTPIPFKEVAGTGKKMVTFDHVEIEKATPYAAEDADVTLRIWQILRARMVAEGMVPVYERMERPLIDVVARMERHGILVDRQVLSRIAGDLGQRAAALEAEIYELAGESFNIGSPKQMGEILFGKMGYPGGKKTKTGQWSTGVVVLEELAAAGHDLPRRIVDWRQLTRLKTVYADGLPNFINPDTGRIHTSFQMAATTTGRFSSSDPNLQNIPARTAEGRKIRTAFVAPEGRKLVAADYSQIELRLLCHVADVPQLAQAFADGVDIHALTASQMFQVPIEGMDPLVRSRAKAINFGIIYGISAFGLANNTGVDRQTAGEYIKTYFERFPGIRDYIEETKGFVREHGYVETIFGRRAHYPDIRASNPQMRALNERAAINAPIQGASADIIRRAMTRMEAALAAAKIDAKMLLQVHDELIFEMDEETVEAAIPVIKDVMVNAAMPAVDLQVPLAVEASSADNWNEAH